MSFMGALIRCQIYVIQDSLVSVLSLSNLSGSIPHLASIISLPWLRKEIQIHRYVNYQVYHDYWDGCNYGYGGWSVSYIDFALAIRKGVDQEYNNSLGLLKVIK